LKTPGQETPDWIIAAARTLGGRVGEV
jgi:hypothetical protein